VCVDDVLWSIVRCPSEAVGWKVGDIDLEEYLDHYRDQQLVIIIAPVGAAEPETASAAYAAL